VQSRAGGGRQGYNGKSPATIRADLRSRGFNRIIFTDRVLPTYVVRACKRGRRMELRINGNGRIRDRQRIGRCDSVREAMRPPQVRRVLETRGFSRIIFIDHQLPVYVVEACRYDSKYELRLNRFARVKRKTDIGPCRVRKVRYNYSPSRVRDILQRRGYEDIKFFDRELPRYGVTACKRGQKFRMYLNRFAEIRQRRRTGFCNRPRVAPPVVNTYEEIDDSEIDASGRIDPETCQNYLDALVHRNRIHFDVASAVVRDRSHRLLRRLSRVMNRCPDSRIEIAVIRIVMARVKVITICRMSALFLLPVSCIVKVFQEIASAPPAMARTSRSFLMNARIVIGRVTVALNLL